MNIIYIHGRAFNEDTMEFVSFEKIIADQMASEIENEIAESQKYRADFTEEMTPEQFIDYVNGLI